MNIIEVVGLSFCYTDHEYALDNVTMRFKKGRTTAILGGNGSGKSTLFLNLNGVLKPESGKVIFNGEEILYNKKDLLKLRRNIGIVFQNPDDQLFSSDVKKDISFGLVNQGLSVAEINERIEFVIGKVGIASLINKPTHALSFGQKKRVAIAGVLAMQPSVIILDEPTAGLDPCGVSDILHLLNEIKQSMNVSVIMSTHDIDIIPLYCDDVYVLDKGRWVFEGTPNELVRNAKLLRDHNLRLPRITHLMEVLHHKDKLNVDAGAATISEARSSIKKIFAQCESADGYIVKSGTKLRLGFTTGSCAAAAAKAAAIMLLQKQKLNNVRLTLPDGKQLLLDIEDALLQDETSVCCVKKDAGDDPDVTNGIKVYASVEKVKNGIKIDGGIGVGRITKKGLPFKIGQAAINPVPTEMIKNALQEVADLYDYSGGFNVEIYVPDGAEVAKKTFNPRLGIVGGISILGTTGIVEPMSERALIETIKLEIDAKKRNSKKVLFVSPGNYGLNFARQYLALDIDLAVKCSNFIGETLDYALYLGFEKLLLVGHIGKLVKLAAGVMNTHSKTADCRNEIFACHAALCGADTKVAEDIMKASTTDEIHSILIDKNIVKMVYDSILKRILFHVNYRTHNKIRIELIVFNNVNGILMQTNNAADFIQELRR